MATRRIPSETLIELYQRLGQLPSRSTERRALVRETAKLYGVSEYTIYRALRERASLRSPRRADCRPAESNAEGHFGTLL